MFALASRSGLHQHTSIRSFACFSRRCSSSTLIVSSCMILCRKTCNCALKTRVKQQAHMQTRDGDVRGSLEVGSATCAWKSWKSCSCDWRSANSMALLVLTVTLRESQRRSGKGRCNAARRQTTRVVPSTHMTWSDVYVFQLTTILWWCPTMEDMDSSSLSPLLETEAMRHEEEIGYAVPQIPLRSRPRASWMAAYHADCTRSTHCVLHPASVARLLESLGSPTDTRRPN